MKKFGVFGILIIMTVLLAACSGESPAPTLASATPPVAVTVALPTPTLAAANVDSTPQAMIGDAPLLATLTLSSPLSPTDTPAPLPTATLDPNALNPTEQQVYELLNKQRTDAGLPPTALDQRLTALARSRSQDMAARNYFDHVTPDGTNFVDMLKQQGIGYRGTGEIIATDTYPDDQTAIVTVDGWMHSKGHHDIIMTPEYTLVGVGQAVNGDTHIYTAIYLTP